MPTAKHATTPKAASTKAVAPKSSPKAATKTAKLAKYPASTTLGGMEINGAVCVAADGSEVLYFKSTGVGRIRRGEKQLTRLNTEHAVQGAAAAGAGLVAVAVNDDDGPRIDVYDDNDAIVATLPIANAFSVSGCTASSTHLVAWGSASEEASSLTLWWWPLPTADNTRAAPACVEIDTNGVVEVAWVGAQLCVTSGTRAWLATADGARSLPLPDGMEPWALSGSRVDRLAFRSGRRFVVLNVNGTLLAEVPPVLKFARLSPDGRHLIGYGEGHNHTTPAAVRDAFPEWEGESFLARFDVDSGARVAWTKSKVVTGLAVLDDDTLLTIMLKGLGFVPWPR